MIPFWTFLHKFTIYSPCHDLRLLWKICIQWPGKKYPWFKMAINQQTLTMTDENNRCFPDIQFQNTANTVKHQSIKKSLNPVSPLYLNILSFNCRKGFLLQHFSLSFFLSCYRFLSGFLTNCTAFVYFVN